MSFIDDLKQKYYEALAPVTKTLSSLGSPQIMSPVPQQQTPSIGQQLGSAYNSAMISLGNSPVGKGIVSAQNWLESSKPTQIVPQMQPFSPKTLSGSVGNMAANLPGSIVNTVVGKGVIDPAIDVGRVIGNTLGGRQLPTYDSMKSAPARLGYQLGNQLNPSVGAVTPQTAREYVGNVAGSLEAPATVYGGGRVFGIGKEAAAQAADQTLKEALIHGAKVGSVLGGGGGLLSALSEGRNIKNDNEYYKNLFVQTATGLATGAFAGAAAEGLGNVVGQIQSRLVDVLKQKRVNNPLETANQFIRDEMGRFAGRKPAGKEPIFYGDLRESLGLPRTGNYKGGFVDFSGTNDPALDPIVQKIKNQVKLTPEEMNYASKKLTVEQINELSAGFKPGERVKADTEAFLKQHPELEKNISYQGTGKGAIRRTFDNGQGIHDLSNQTIENSKGGNITEEAVRLLRSAQGNPNAEITVYRGAPKGAGINSGDWIALDKNVAEKFTRSRFGKPIPNYEVQELKVKAKDIVPQKSAGKDRIYDFAYYPELNQGSGYTGQPIQGSIQPGEPGVSNGNTLLNADTSAQKTLSSLSPKRTQTGNMPESLQNNTQSAPQDKIISQGYKEIGSLKDEPQKTWKQTFDKFYTDWVDRYHPLTQLAQQAENVGKKAGFELRPENNPRYTVRRFLGMGGIAEQRYNSELKPILQQIEQSGIKKEDMDLFLKSQRDINLASRGIKGSDAQVAQQRIDALTQRYGDKLSPLADKLYQYQSKGFKELVDAGFIKPEVAQQIQDRNQSYVPFQRVMDQVDEYLGIPSKVAQQKVNPIKEIKGSDKQIYSPLESIIGNTYKQRSAIEKNNVAQSVLGLKNVIPDIGFKQVTKEGPDTITVWQNGERQHWQVGEDVARAMKGMNEESVNGFLKVLTLPATILRQGATGRNPDFMVPNMVKDQLDAAINSKYGYVPVVDYIRGLSHLIKKDNIYQSWLKSGGSQELAGVTGRKSIQEMFDAKKARQGLFSWLGKGLDFMGTYSEQPTRLGLYAKALQKTGNPTLAAYESRSGTMDFARMGAKMKVANSIIPFLNVGVQGFDQMVRNVKDNPVKFSTLMGIYAITPTVLSTLYNVTQYPDEYKQIPQYVKDSNFVFVTGKNKDGSVDYFSIPKGNAIKLASNPVENFISYLADTSKESVGEMATQFLSSTLPAMASGSSIKEVAIKTIGQNLPQAIKPITENLVNKSFFKYDPKSEQSKGIVPYYMQNKPPGEQTYKFTPAMYQGIGRVLNVSPLQVQNLMEGYLAGYTKIPAQIIENLKSISEGNPTDKNQIPILRRFFQSTYAPSPNAAPEPPRQPRTSLFQPAQAAEQQAASIIPSAQASATDYAAKNKTIADARKSLRQSDKTTTWADGKILIKTDSNRTELIDPNKQPVAPSLTGVKEIDKLKLSKFSGEITQKKNDIVTLLDRGYITQQEATDQIKKLDELMKSVKPAGTGIRKPKKLRAIRMPKVRAIKSKAVKLPKVKQIKSKVYKIKQTKLKKVSKLT